MASNQKPTKQGSFTIKWILGISIAIVGLICIIKGSFLGGLLLGLVGLAIIPPIAEKSKERFAFWRNNFTRRGLLVVLAIIGLAVSGNQLGSKSIDANKNNTTTSKNSDKISPYQSYIDETTNKINQLSPDRKQQRDKMYAELKANYVYKLLVDSTLVSMDYIPCLTAISNGITYSNNEGFSIDDKLVKNIANSSSGAEKSRFVTLVVALSGVQNGGVPKEIIDVFERYKDKFRIYGERGVLVGGNGNQTQITEDYDLTPFYGMIDPKNHTVLDKFYEAKQKGISDWANAKNPTFPYLSSKEDYMSYVKQVYPESPYILKVDYEVTASQIYNEYEANEVSADEKYKNKKVAVTGKIGTIGKDILDNPYVSLNVGYLQSVNCYFSDENNKILSQLAKGEKVTIIGECRGLTLTDVVIKDCELYE